MGVKVLLVALLFLSACGDISSSSGPMSCNLDIHRVYDEVQACVGITAPEPVVIYKDFEGPMAQISLGTGVILINTNPSWASFRTCETDEKNLKREYVHWLLQAADFPLEDNVAHNSILFEVCNGS